MVTEFSGNNLNFSATNICDLPRLVDDHRHPISLLRHSIQQSTIAHEAKHFCDRPFVGSANAPSMLLFHSSQQSIISFGILCQETMSSPPDIEHAYTPASCKRIFEEALDLLELIIRSEQGNQRLKFLLNTHFASRDFRSFCIHIWIASLTWNEAPKELIDTSDKGEKRDSRPWNFPCNI